MHDYLNKEKKRNELNTPTDLFNCGGFALRTYSWYLPWEDEYEILDELNNEQLEYDAAVKYINEFCQNYMITEFEGTIRIAPYNLSYDPEKEELIAFRSSVNHFFKNNSVHYFDIEFHFKVFREGKWMEKLGSEPITSCEDDNNWDYREEDEWCDLYYNSPTLYLLHRIDDNV